MTMPRNIKALLNRLAHAEGLAHEEVAKRRMLADLERLKAQGASYAQLVAHLEQQGSRTP